MNINWFVNISEILSLVPTLIGVLLRRIWYKHTLKRCGEHVSFSHLSACRANDVQLGDWVSVGRNSWLGHCTIGNHVVIANNVTVLSGMHQHKPTNRETAMIWQKGECKHINIGDDVWIGSHAIIGADVSKGTIVGASAVVTKTFPEYSIIAGVPAKVIGVRA